MRKNNSKYCVALIAGIAAAIGIIVAIGVYLRKKASIIGEQLDFDPDMFDDEDYFDSEEEAMSEEDAMVEITDTEISEDDYETATLEEAIEEESSTIPCEPTNKID